MNDEQIQRFLQRTMGGGTDMGPRSTFRPTEAARDAPARGTPELPSEADYELLDRIAEGGMGVVYLARQPRLDRIVAVKTVRPDASGDASVARFVAEARVTGHLAHPNIVPVIDLGRSSGGETYLSMKLVGGRSWERLLGAPAADAASVFLDLDDDGGAEGSAAGLDGEEPPPRLGADLDPHLDIFLAVCNAIAFAHSRGFIHRDIKPANVMVGEFGEVLVMDWGLAVDIGGEEAPDRPAAPHKNEVTEPWGTPCYLAPEMADGRGRDFGPWTDVFLLGATLYEVVMHRPPHRGRTLREVLETARSPAPPALPDAVPEELAAILARAMAPEPRDRYPDVAALRHAVRSFREHGESTRLTTAARTSAAEAARLATDPADEDTRTRAYGLFTAAIAGFEQALVLWPENGGAVRGERDARTAFARTALAAGDLALARAQLTPLDGAEAAELGAAVERAETARRHARRTNRRLRRGLAAAAVLIVVAVGFLVTRWDDILRGREEAERGRIEALLHEGYYQLGEGSNALAVAAFDDILATTEEPPAEAVAGLALAHLRGGESARAAALLARHAPDPNDRRFGWIHAELMRQDGRGAEADALEKKLDAPSDALGFFVLGVRESQVAHLLELRGHAGDEAARAAGDAAFRRSLDALTRAMLYSESVRGLYLFSRAHVAGHLRDEAAAKECVDVISQRFADSSHGWFWAGFALHRIAGRQDDAHRCYAKAHELAPDDARIAFSLGSVIMEARPREAEPPLRRALELAPDDPETNCNLGHVMVSLGGYAEGLRLLRRGHELGTARGHWPYASAHWVEHAERLLEVERKFLPAILAGEARLPLTDARRLIELEKVARSRGRGAELTATWEKALAGAGPGVDPSVFFRAACAALIVGAPDAPSPTAVADRAAYRARAAGWIGECLHRCRGAGRAGLIPPKLLAQNIEQHFRDGAIDSVREGPALDRLPEEERRRWRALWAEARALIEEFGGG